MIGIASRLGIVATAIALGGAAAAAQQVGMAPPGNAGGSTGPTFPNTSADSTGATAVPSAPGPAALIAGVNVGTNGRPTPSSLSAGSPMPARGLASGLGNGPQH